MIECDCKGCMHSLLVGKYCSAEIIRDICSTYVMMPVELRHTVSTALPSAVESTPSPVLSDV